MSLILIKMSLDGLIAYRTNRPEFSGKSVVVCAVVQKRVLLSWVLACKRVCGL